MLKKETDLEFEIRDIAFGGAGVGRVEEKACFIRGVIDGEKVRGHVSKAKARFMEVDLLEVLEPSPHRVEPPCPYFLKCGGCAYQHIDYAHQLKIKEQQLREALRRIGGIENPPVSSIISSPKPFHYRNRITVHVREGALGFFAEKSRDVVSIDQCLLASEEVNQALQQLRSQRPQDGNYLLGEKKSYGGFRQVNDEVAKLLLDEVIRLAGSGELLVDAYCGAGFFAHALRHAFKKIIGIERSRGSISLARQEACENEEFLEGGVEELLPEVLAASRQAGGWRLKAEGHVTRLFTSLVKPSQNDVQLPATCNLQPVTLILDPPSEGLSELVSAAILRTPPQKIIYVSCNPATLARDLKRLSSHYQLQETTPLDMFPQTAEIESVSMLLRNS